MLRSASSKRDRRLTLYMVYRLNECFLETAPAHADSMNYFKKELEPKQVTSHMENVT